MTITAFQSGRERHEMHSVNRVFPDFTTLESETKAYANRMAENERLTFTALE